MLDLSLWKVHSSDLLEACDFPANDQKDTDFQSDGSSRVFGEETRAKVHLLLILIIIQMHDTVFAYIRHNVH